MAIKTPLHEPHKIKTVRRIPFPSLEVRKKNLADAQFNVFNLTPSQINFDMCSYGTGAMSQEQLSGQLLGDEAYAGAVNFENLQKAVCDVLGHTYVCPTHNILGAVKLTVATLVPEGAVVPTNGLALTDILKPRNVHVVELRDREQSVFTGNIDLKRLEETIDGKKVALISIQAFADGQHPFSLANLMAVRQLADRRGLRLVLDASRIIEQAWYVQKHEKGQADRTIADIVKQMAKSAHILMLDGAMSPKAPCGGVLATDNPVDHEKFINEVVVYEGLHTYGGMAGRSMEVLARGIREMCIEAEVQWVMHQTEAFTNKLRDAGVPIERGCDGAYIQANLFLPHIKSHAQHAFSAALYQISGIRAVAQGMVGRDEMVPVQIPRLAMTSQQLDQIAKAILCLYKQRDQVAPLELTSGGTWHDQLRFRSVFPTLETFTFDTCPYLIHTIERVADSTKEQRQKAIREAGYNTFLLRSADVTIDLLTDSGTSAMSTEQWSAYDGARATPCVSEAYKRLVDVVRDVYGYEHVIPTHQGRAAEHILSQTLIRPGQLVPGNMYFTTTKLHQELAGGVFVDIIVDEAHDPSSEHPWKGNIDMRKLRQVVEEHGAKKIAYISFEHSVNMAGGQPVSMDNMKEVYAYCNPLGIPVLFDATRSVENAFMIQKKDPRFHDTSIRDILREMMVYGDGFTVSGKKDFLINIGGLLAFRDNLEWKNKAEELLRIHEGSVTNGGLAASDLAVIARGIEEMLDDRYIRSRVNQAEELGRMLVDAGVPIVTPPGTHAIFLDARRFLPHLDQDEYPSQALAAEIFVETGVRAMERGNVSKGRDPKTGKNYRPALELVRLTLPRRVYSSDHMRAIADGVIRLYQRRDTIQGLKFVYEPTYLRFFQARFEPIPRT